MTDSFIRTSRRRRIAAYLGWGLLVFTAFFLWDARLSGSMRLSTSPPVALILSVFSAFVAVFAWLLFNPGRRNAVESPSLFFAAAATLFPPPIIGYSLLGTASPFAGWLALGLFLLCVTAILSHVPEDFFGVPRDRHSYLVPMPVFDRVENDALDPNAPWFRFTDLTELVGDIERPSLAPRAYLQRDTLSKAAARTAEVVPLSTVDDLLGTDVDIDLLEDPLWEIDAASGPTSPAARRVPQRSVRNTDDVPTVKPQRFETTHDREIDNVADDDLFGIADWVEPDYTSHQTESQYLNRTRQSKTRRDDESADESTRYSADSTTTTPPLPPFPGVIPARQRSTDSPSHDYRRPDFVPLPESGAEDESPRESENRQSRPESKSSSGWRRKDRNAGQRSQQSSSSESSSATQRSVRKEADTDRRQRQSQDVPKPLRQERSEHEPRKTQRSSEDVADQRHESTVYEHQRSEQKEKSHSGVVPLAAAGGLAAGASSQEHLLRSADSTTESESSKKQSTDIHRTKDTSGSELVEGVMTVRFDKGQKRANIHVPFSPPLTGIPEVECECVGDEPLRLKVPVRQSYGIRIEARRSNADEPMEAEVGFAAISPTNQS